MIERYTSFLIAHRKTVIIVSFIISLVTSLGFFNARLSTDFLVYFSDENPDLLNMKRLSQSFGGEDSLYLAAIPEDGTVYSERYLDMMRQLTRDFDRVPYVF